MDWLPLYVETRDRFATLARGFDGGQASTPVPACPGWDVHAVVSHLTGVLADIQSGRLDEVGTAAWTQFQVDARRDRTLRDVVDEWDALQGFAHAAIPGMGANGGLMVADTLIHELDVRLALGLPVPTDSASFAAVVERYVDGLAERIAGAGLGPVGILSGGRSWVVGDGQPVASVRVDQLELVRGLTGRRTPGQVADWDWDTMGEDYAAVWSAYGVPDADLVELAD